jgi:hypothetical protein
MKAEQLKEGLADLAYKAESDHEVQMARAELYKIAKYAIKMHEMLKGVEEREGLEGWVQSKITKAADYMGSVYHHMDYEQKFDEVQEGKKKAQPFDADKNWLDAQNSMLDHEGKPKPEYAKKQKQKESYKSSLASILAEKVKSKTCCGTCGNEAAVEGQQYDEAKQRLDPKCWKGKKIGTPATKMKGGVRVNNCVPA